MVGISSVPEETPSFSCNGLVTSVDVDTLVDGDRPYELCITEESDAKSTCFDMRNDGQVNASIKSCAQVLAGTTKEQNKLEAGEEGEREEGGGIEKTCDPAQRDPAVPDTWPTRR